MIVNVHEAKTHLSRLLARVAAGEEIILGKAGKPVARLVAYRQDREPRRFGQFEGRITVAEDFDELPEWLIHSFEGDPVADLSCDSLDEPESGTG